jgi:hypothetical protein
MLESRLRYKPRRNTSYTKPNVRKQTPKKKRKHVKSKKLAAAFFDLTQPCPPDIKNCAELRKYYSDEIEKLQKYNLCAQCNVTFLKINVIEQFDID